MAQLRPSAAAWSTAQERVFDVSLYGALADGSTDATAAIQAAAAAAAAAGGGIVYIPVGSFIVSAAIVLGSKVSVAGAGSGSILISLASNAWSDQGFISVPVGVSDVTIRDLVLDGNKANNATGRSYGVKIEGATNVCLVRVVAKNHPDNGSGNGGDGLYIGKSGTTRPQNILVSECDFDSNVRQGVSITSGRNVRIENSVLRNTSGSNPGAGIDVEPNSNGAADKVDDLIVTGCVIDACEEGIVIPNPNQAVVTGVVIQGNVIRSCRARGLQIAQIQAGDTVTVSGNEIYSNATIGVDVSGSSAAGSIRIVGNSIRGNTTIGVKVADSRRVMIVGNAIVLNGQHGISVGKVFSGELAVSIVGNEIFNNGTGTGNTYDGISFTGDATHNNFATLVEGNWIGNQASMATSTQRDGVRVPANADNVGIIGNTFVGHLGSAITNSGANTIAALNRVSSSVVSFGATGAQITQHLTATGTLAFGPINANVSGLVTMTVTGASVGDSVVVTPNGSPGTDLVWCGRVSASDTVSVVLGNVSTGNVATSDRVWRADVWKH